MSNHSQEIVKVPPLPELLAFAKEADEGCINAAARLRQIIPSSFSDNYATWAEVADAFTKFRNTMKDMVLDAGHPEEQEHNIPPVEDFSFAAPTSTNLEFGRSPDIYQTNKSLAFPTESAKKARAELFELVFKFIKENWHNALKTSYEETPLFMSYLITRILWGRIYNESAFADRGTRAQEVMDLILTAYIDAHPSQLSQANRHDINSRFASLVHNWTWPAS